MVHSDVWGPAPIVAYSGYRYFVTFVDDCTRCTWVYLMKEKDEVANLFQRFFNRIHTQYGKRMKVLRSDNGGEYMASSLATFLHDQGVIHQFSCPDTPLYSQGKTTGRVSAPPLLVKGKLQEQVIH